MYFKMSHAFVYMVTLIIFSLPLLMLTLLNTVVELLLYGLVSGFFRGLAKYGVKLGVRDVWVNRDCCNDK